VPLLALFGSLHPDDYVARNPEAFAAAKERAKANLQRCVVANTDDMSASAVLVAHFFPWLSTALGKERVGHKNSGEQQVAFVLAVANAQWRTLQFCSRAGVHVCYHSVTPCPPLAKCGHRPLAPPRADLTLPPTGAQPRAAEWHSST
jgi:hypothetical protein